jgi:hypothetical protein
MDVGMVCCSRRTKMYILSSISRSPKCLAVSTKHIPMDGRTTSRMIHMPTMVAVLRSEEPGPE